MKKVLSTLGILLVTLSAYSQTINGSDAIRLLASSNNSQVSNDSNDSAVIKSAYKDPQTGLQFISLQQLYKGIRVFNAVRSVVFREEALQSSVSTFIKDMTVKAPDNNPSVAVTDAIAKAAIHLALPSPAGLTLVENNFATDKKLVYSPAGIAKQNILAELVWVSDNDSAIHLAWNVSIDVMGSPDYWNVRVDAHTGNIINKNNYTLYDNFNGAAGMKDVKKKQGSVNVKNENTLSGNTDFQPAMMAPAPPPTVTSATYNVIPFPLENRFTGNIAIETDPWKKAGTANNATSYGWHFDGTTSYNYTRGNNVYAYDDSLNLNAPGRSDTSSTTGTILTFNNTPDFTKQATSTTNRRFATDNLFYWNNIMHDLSYQYGFTEPAGNFQQDNMGRGPVGTTISPITTAGNDYVHAEAQDGSGLNNANFSTPPDGLPGKMQMYLFTPVVTNNFALNISAPASLKGAYASTESAFSTANKLISVGPVTGSLVLYKDDNSGTVNFACNAPVNAVSGKIAVILRGGPSPCSMFINKVKNAQNAGAIGVIMIDNNQGVVAMGGTDNTITIPAVMTTAVNGTTIINALNANQTITATLSAPIQFDGDIDNGVVSHEYTHGISNRLTGGLAGNASCLTNNEQGGEGWSDYMALMVTTDWTKAKLNDGALSRPVGVYVAEQVATGVAGIRTYPYSTDMTINPHTYAHVSNNGTFPQRDNNGGIIPNATEVHYIGEIWCSAIWDMTWGIIQQEGTINPDIYNVAGGGGNVKALQLVIMGLKLQPCSPGFLDARDAILKADSILYNFAHKCAIWTAFARRGMGFSAVQGSSNSTTDQTPKFDVPLFVTPNITVGGIPLGGVCAGNNLTFSTSITNGGTLPIYQWIKNGTNISEAGANSATFTTNKLNDGDIIKCKLTSNTGCATSANVTSSDNIITVKPIPVVAVTAAGALSICPGDSVVLTSNATSGNQWYTNGTLVTAPPVNGVYVAKASGSYTDSLTGSNGCRAGNAPVVITMKPAPVAVITAASATGFCAGLSVLLKATAVTGNTYQWLKDATAITAATDTNYTANASGAYTISVTGTNGCKTISAGTTVTVNPFPPVPVITAGGPTTFCDGKNVVLTSSAATGNQWINGTVTIPGANGTSYTATTAGNYTVVTTTASGCATASSVTTVSTNALPVVPTITAGGPTTFCSSGGNVVLTSSSATSYQWNKDGTAITGATNATYAATASGAYTVSVSNANGCVATSAATNATAAVVAAPTIIQQSDTLVSSASAGNQWYLNTTTIPGAVNQKYKILNTGSYTVQVTDANGCKSAFSLPLAVVITAVTNVTLNNKEWKIFPNPVTNGILIIQHYGALNGTATAQLVTQDGRLVGEKAIAQHTEWNISAEAPGSYYLRIIEKKSVSVYQFVKQ